MLFSVVVPIYNVQFYIKRCVESILSQTFTDFECVFINDCTPDDSMKILSQLIEKYTGDIRLKVIEHQENKGLSEARNTGIKNAEGRYIFFLDSDDAITKDCLESFSRIIYKFQSSVDVVAGSFLPVSEAQKKLQLNPDELPILSTRQDEIINLMMNKIPAMACNKVYCRDFLIKNKLVFMPGILHEDELWNFQIMKKIRQLALNFQPTYFYYIRPDSITTNCNKRKSFDSSLLIIASCAKNMGDIQERIQTYYLWQWLCKLRLSEEYVQIKNRKKQILQIVKSILKMNIPITSKLYFSTLVFSDFFLKVAISVDVRLRSLFFK